MAYLIQDGITLPDFWFEQPRAREIIAEAIRTNGACFEADFTGPLIEELADLRKQADEEIEAHFRLEQKFDRRSIRLYSAFKRIIAEHWNSYYRVQLKQPIDVLLCAMGHEPRDGTCHEPALEAAIQRALNAQDRAAA